MNDKYIYSIGLMSGTSLDGLDIVYVKFHKNDYGDFEIIHSNTIKYSEFWEARLKNSIHLYNKFGFKKINIENNTPYKRSDIKMELLLSNL